MALGFYTWYSVVVFGYTYLMLRDMIQINYSKKTINIVRLAMLGADRTT